MNEPETQPTSQPTPQPFQPVTPKRKSPIVWVVLLLLVGAGGAAYYYTTQLTNTATETNSSAGSSSVQQYLLESSQDGHGVSVGYLKVDKATSRGNLLVGQAQAEAPEYQTVVFYEAADDRLFMMKTATKEETVVANQGSSNPVMSSLAQTLAYNKGACTLVLKNLADNTEFVAKQGAKYTSATDTASVCYQPSAWSPDGKKLAVIGQSLADAKLGLVTLSKLHVYDLDTKTLVAYEPPAGFNTTLGGVRWLDSGTIALSYVEFGQNASVIKDQPYKLTLATKAFAELGDNYKYEFGTAKTVGATLFAHTQYVKSGDVSALVSGPTDGTDLKKVEGSDGAGTFLVKANPSATEATDIFLLNGSAGSENTFNLMQLPAAGGTAAKVFSPKGFSAYMLGWGKDFDQILYMAVLSGKSEVRQYTISTKTDEALVSDLPLLQ